MAQDIGFILSRFAFIFLVYSVVTSGYIGQVLSCQMQHFLSDAVYFRHVLGVVMVFVFIMSSGGWSFAEEDKDKDNNASDWSNGNALSSMAISMIIYLIFLISSKSQLLPSLTFFSITFCLYLINSQRAYWFARDKITKEMNEGILIVEAVMLFFAIIVLIYGFVDYVLYQQNSYGDGFKWELFLLGTNKCKSLA